MQKDILNRHRNEPLDKRQEAADKQRAMEWHKACSCALTPAEMERYAGNEQEDPGADGPYGRII